MSVLVTQHTLAPMRLGFLRRGDAYEAEPLLSFVEPLTAEVAAQIHVKTPAASANAQAALRLK